MKLLALPWVFLTALFFAGSALAKPGLIDTNPFPRIEVAQHTSLIRRAEVDQSRDLLYTAADDKTIRVWQLPELKSLKVFRVPVSAGHEGQLFGLALSVDGTVIAAAGWTGWDKERTASVFLIDAQSGAFLGRIKNLPQGVSALRFLGTSNYLAIGLMGNAGLRVVDVRTQQVLLEDTEYGADIRDIVMNKQGELAVASLDKFVRLYGADYTLLGRVKPDPNATPLTVRYSPNNRQLAVGYFEHADVHLLNSDTLQVDLKIKANHLTLGKNVHSLEWLKGDHRAEQTIDRLCVAGEALKAKLVKTACFQVTHGANNSVQISDAQSYSVAHSSINGIVRWKNDWLVLLTGEPALHVMNKAGKIEYSARSSVLNFEGTSKLLALSDDAQRVQFTADNGAGELLEPMLFDVAHGQLDTKKKSVSQRGVKLIPPRQTVPGQQFDLADRYKPTLNQQALQLEAFERVESHAWSTDGNALLLGTSWALRHLDHQGKQHWIARLSASAWAVNLSEDGKWAVAALSDGTIRWFSTATGREHLAYFQHANRSDWIAWQPNGLYMSSPAGDQFLGWHINRGMNQAPDFFLAAQFERTLYKPERVQKTLLENSATPDNLVLQNVLPPRVSIRTEKLVQRASGEWALTLRIKGETLGPRPNDFIVFVNQIPVTAPSERRLGWRDRSGFEREIQLVLRDRFNELRVEAMTDHSLGLAQTTIPLPEKNSSPIRQQRDLGNLYVFAVGVSGFKNLSAEHQLDFAASDAVQFSQAMQQFGSSNYRKVNIRLLADQAEQGPTKNNIEDALKFLSQARAQDTVMMFLASHAVQDVHKNYYFVPADVTVADLKSLNDLSPNSRTKRESLISWEVFFEALRNTAGRRILIVDTCHAQGIEGRLNPASLIKRSVSSLFPMLLASAKDEDSQEYAPAGRGLFTHGLLEGLQQTTASGRTLTVQSWFDQAVPLVTQLRDQTIGQQTPQLIATSEMRNWQILGQ
ncbi:caspase family protein [Limnobacter alexandrii]|uniref:caspase family protein n=1 Tax=Limnobacter alexandrii TaxID=2570352 RepID=UPI00110889D3|nr:caspase family protein [Limnobacter alexandrii]